MSNVDERDQRGRTALMYAVEKRQTQAVAVLLARGADLNARDEAGWTPLFLALMKAAKNIVMALLNAGADCQNIDYKGDHALVISAWLGYTDVVQSLLDRGINVDGPTSYKALMIAVNSQRLEVVQILLRSGLDLTQYGDKHLLRWVESTLSPNEKRRMENNPLLALLDAAPDDSSDRQLADLVRSVKRDFPDSLKLLRARGVQENPKGREAKRAFVKAMLLENASLPIQIAQIIQDSMTSSVGYTERG